MCVFVHVYICLHVQCCGIDFAESRMYICVHICMCTYKCVYVSDDPVDLLIDYFKKFGHKPCCFDDTHHFIAKLLSTADADKVSKAALIISCDRDAQNF